MAKSKINITIDDDLLQQVDDYCDKNYMNRSVLISQALASVINQQKMIDSMRDLSIAFKKCVETGAPISDELKRDVEAFQALSKYYTFK